MIFAQYCLIFSHFHIFTFSHFYILREDFIMSKELVSLAADALPALTPSLAEFREIAQSSNFLARIQLYTKGKPIDTGLIQPGHYGIPVGDEIDDLGVEIDVLPLTWRSKAIDMTDRDIIIVNYDSSSDEYKRIKEAAQTVNDSHCMYGPTFLVFERSTGKFYEFFFGNRTMRRESNKLLGFCPISPRMAEEILKETGKKEEPRGPRACTLKIKYITKGAYGWHAPVCHQCSTPFNNIPSTDILTAEIKKFHELKNSEAEKVVEASTGKKRAR